MFSREEKKELNTSFFQLFIKRMSRHKSLGGGGIRWESYRTGVRGIFFRLLTFPEVGLAIDLQFKDAEIRALFYDQFEEFKSMLNSHIGEEMVYEPRIMLDSGVIVSRIWVKLEGAHFYDKAQWPAIIDFYEVKLLALDEFWDLVGEVVKGLAR